MVEFRRRLEIGISAVCVAVLTVVNCELVSNRFVLAALMVVPVRACEEQEDGPKSGVSCRHTS